MSFRLNLLMSLAVFLVSLILTWLCLYTAGTVNRRYPSGSSQSTMYTPISRSGPDTAPSPPPDPPKVETSPSGSGDQPDSSMPKPTGAPTAAEPVDVDLTKFTMFELDCMRNEPYARHGYKFRRDDLRAHFSKFSWYKPTTSDQGRIWNELSDHEKDVVQRVKHEQATR